MRIRNIERLADDVTSAGDPVVLRQSFTHHGRRVRAFALMVAGILTSAPFALLLGNEASHAAVLTLAASRPEVMVELAIACLITLEALYFGIYQLIIPAIRQRLILIDQAHIQVEESIGRRKIHWREPVSSYDGIRHMVSTTSEGPMHSLVVEHARADRCLTIAWERNISDEAIAEAAQRLGLPILQNTWQRRSETARWRRSFKSRRGENSFSVPHHATTT